MQKAEKKTYSEEEYRLGLLEQTTENINQTLNRLENKIDKRFDAIDKKFDAIDRRFDAIDKRFIEVGKESKSDFRWIMGSIFGIYITIMGVCVTALVKSMHWL